MTLITGTRFGGVVLGTVIAGASFWFLMQSAPLRNEDACAGCTYRYGPLVIRVSYELPADQTFQSSSRTLVAFSPDGTRFIYNTIDGLYLHTLPQTVVKRRMSVERRINRLTAAIRVAGELTPLVVELEKYVRRREELDKRLTAGFDTEQTRLLSGTSVSVHNPLFSPDGEWIVYFSAPDQQIKKIAVSGGAAVTLVDATIPFGMSWEDMGTVGQFGPSSIFFGQPAGVMQVSANGGTAELVIDARDGEQIHGPQLLPGGEWVLFSSTTVGGSSRRDEVNVVTESVETGERRLLIAGGSDAQYIGTGHLVYAVDDALLAIGLDLGRLEVIDDPVFSPVSLVESLKRANTPQNNTGAGHFSVSDDAVNFVYVEDGSALEQGRTLTVVLNWFEESTALVPVRQDQDAAAVHWYALTAAQGVAHAQFRAGLIFANGRVVTQEDAEAVRWYRLAAEQGYAGAQYNLGVMYETGRGIPQDDVEAYMWYQLAAPRSSGEDRDGYVQARDAVAERMTPGQIAEGQRRAREWMPTAAETPAPRSDWGGWPYVRWRAF